MSYGLDRELAERRAAAYSKEDEARVQEWIEAVTGDTFPSSFADSLKDGKILCRLANKISPGICKKYKKKATLPFVKMENISLFLQAARSLGLPEHSCFCTPDLFQDKDHGAVVRSLISFAKVVEKRDGYSLPTINVTAKKAQSLEDALKPKKAAAKPYNYGDGIVEATITSSGGGGGGASDAESGATAPPTTAIKEEGTAPPSSSPAPAPAPAPSAPAAPVAAPEKEAPSPKPMPPSQPAPAPAPSTSGAGGPGKPAPSESKAEKTRGKANYKGTPMDQVQQWIEEVAEVKFPEGFADSLKDGTILCKFANKIKPKTIPKYNKVAKMPFKKMENIKFFLRALRDFNVPEFECFDTQDLYEEKNVEAVVKTFYALGRRLQSADYYNGPAFGVRQAKRASVNSSKWKSTGNEVSLLNMGSTQYGVSKLQMGN